MTQTEALKIYQEALKPVQPLWRRALVNAWTAAALFGLNAVAWAEPWSGKLAAAALAAGAAPWAVKYVAIPLVMALRGILLVEAFGYCYHRFFQHVGKMTRQSAVFRRNQMFHWVHHMIIYPIGRLYKRAMPYVASESGIAWSWVAPALIAAGIAVASLGLNLGTVVFLSSMGIYAKFVIDVTHLRFHETEHPWASKKYFNWLEEIHLLHHWDQRYNFTIVHPFMDMLFGTYLAPETHKKEMQAAMSDMDLTVSDLINWRYLLLEATPAEYASFISQARRHPRSLRKVGLLLEVLRVRLMCFPKDSEARELDGRARDLVAALKAEGALISSEA